jgi:intracellular sulfur oxidation DsrE/DsrF family protein
MKTAIRTLAALLLTLFALPAQTPPAEKQHRVVMQMNVDSADSWTQLMGNIQNIRKAFGPDKITIEVVAWGKGLGLLQKTNTRFEGAMKQVAAEGVVFAACQNSMRARNVKTEDLFAFATQVDSGVAEVIRKQEAGWSYVRAGE